MNIYQWVASGLFITLIAILVIYRKRPWVKKSWKYIGASIPIILYALSLINKNPVPVKSIIPPPVPDPVSIPSPTPPDSSSIVTPAQVVIGVSYQFSTNFSYGTMTKTEHRDLIEKNIEEGKKYLDHMAKLCNIVLEPVWALMGPFTINSCFRCSELNSIVGGTKNSQHTVAEAADTEYSGLTLQQAFNKIAFSSIPYSQCIIEWGWIHIGLIDPILYPDKIRQKLWAEQKIDNSGNKTVVYTTVSTPL